MSIGKGKLLVVILTLAAMSVEFSLTSAVSVAARGHEYDSPLTGVVFGETFGVALDPTTEKVYATDKGTGVLDVFNAKGEYEEQFQGPFTTPRAVGVNPVTHDIYVTGGAEGEGTITELDQKGTVIASLTGPSFGRLVSVAVYGETGKIFVADAGNNVVDEFNSNGGYAGQLTDLSSAVTGVAVNQSNGQLYVDESQNGVNSAVAVFNANGEFQFKFDGEETPAHQFLALRGAVDSSTGEVYVADSEHGVVDVFNAAGEYLSQFDGSATPMGSIEPYGMAVNSVTGDVYIADVSHATVDIFRSLPLPSAIVEPVSGITAAGAHLTGIVNAEGVEEVKYQFEYSTGASYEPETTLSTPEVSDGAVGDLPASATIEGLSPGTLYHVRLVATSKNGAVHSRDTTFVTSSLPPLISSLSASEVTPFAATLSGSIAPGNGVTSYHYVYGVTSAYGQTTITETVGGLDDTMGTPQRIGGLAPGTLYHFALIAENRTGVAKSTDHTFTTAPAVMPEATTGAAAGVSATTATLEAVINPRGLPTAYSFLVGPDTNYGTVLSGNAGTANVSGTVTASLQGLAPGSTVHFRVVASNAAGAVYGQDMVFTTPSLAPSISQPVAPLLLSLPPTQISSPLVVVSRRLSGKRVLVTVRLTEKGAVTFSGAAIKTVKSSLGVGDHQIKLSLSRAGLKDRSHHRTVTLKVMLKAGTLPQNAGIAAVVTRTTTVQL